MDEELRVTSVLSIVFMASLIGLYCAYYIHMDFLSLENDQLTGESFHRLALLSFALEAFHEEHGDYPIALDEIVPRYIDKVPENPFKELMMYESVRGYQYQYPFIRVNNISSYRLEFLVREDYFFRRCYFIPLDGWDGEVVGEAHVDCDGSKRYIIRGEEFGGLTHT